MSSSFTAVLKDFTKPSRARIYLLLVVGFSQPSTGHVWHRCLRHICDSSAQSMHKRCLHGINLTLSSVVQICTQQQSHRQLSSQAPGCVEVLEPTGGPSLRSFWDLLPEELPSCPCCLLVVPLDDLQRFMAQVESSRLTK